MKKHQAFLKEIENKFRNFSSSLESLEKQLAPLIIHWEWATETQHHLGIFAVERARLSKGKKLKNEPNIKKCMNKMGFDSLGNLLFEERFENHDSHGFKKYYIRNKNSIQAYTFQKDGTLDLFEQQILKDGKPMWYGIFGDHRANSVDQMIYSGPKITMIKTLRIYQPHLQFPTYDIEYNLANKVSKITRIDEPSDSFPDGQKLIIYNKSNIRFSEITKIIIEKSLEQVIKELQSLDTNSPIYCLILSLYYPFNGDDWFPPKITFATHNERLAFGLDSDKIWSPMEYKNNIQDSDIKVKGERIAELSQLFMQECELKEKYLEPSKLIIQLAKKLKEEITNNYEQFNLTEDFIIVPFDIPDGYDETGVLTKINKIYNSKELKKMKSYGWIK